jgi:hypothetical protein
MDHEASPVPPSTWGPRARRLWIIATGVALAAAATVLQALSPGSYEERYAPLAATGGLRQVVDAGPFEVRADKVDIARTLTGVGKTVTPDGVFVVVTVSARTDTEILTLSTATLRTADGREFTETDTWVIGSMSGWHVQPEVWRRGEFLFEVPALAVPGATLQLSDRTSKDPRSGPWEWPRVGYELAAQADIDLAITGRMAASPLESFAPTIGEPA